MTWTMIDTWIVLVGLVTALSCALIGNFLVVRRMSLMGDAISHAVLPGLAAAFLISGTRNPVAMLAGAVTAGLCAAFITEWIQRRGNVEETSAMGVVFTSLFALGLLLIVRAADEVDLDPGCVLYGAIELAPLDLWRISDREVPRAFVMGLAVLVINAIVLVLFYKEFKITAFDPETATALGFPARRMYYLLMTLVALTTVASFESVGSILVIAMLIVPPAAAQFLSYRLGAVIGWSLVLAAVSAIGGHVAAITVPVWFGFVDTSTAGVMAVVSGLLFAGCFMLAPERGWLSRWRAQRSLRQKILREDILGSLYRWEEQRPAPAGGLPVGDLPNRTGQLPEHLQPALARLCRDHLVTASDRQTYRLTGAGRIQAASIIRDHRLWEHYLHDQVSLPPDHVHSTSEQLEHHTDEKIRRELRQAAGSAKKDPHGKIIPEAPGAGAGDSMIR